MVGHYQLEYFDSYLIGFQRTDSNNLGVLLITHYTRILRYIKPDFVHVFANGRVVEEGGPELADKLESQGYAEYVGN